MSLFIRYKNEIDRKLNTGTMERHLAIYNIFGKFYWGQYSNAERLFSDDRINEIRAEEDRRIIFYDSQSKEVYVGELSNIYSHSDKSLEKRSIEKFIPEYYREELHKTEDSKVTAWLEVTSINLIAESDRYLDNIFLKSDKNCEKSIKESLRGQTSRFYIQNKNEYEVYPNYQYDEKIIERNEKLKEIYTPSEENKKSTKMMMCVVREGREKFRNEILNNYDNKCCISECNISAVLEAAHVTPYNGSDSNNIPNGICLRSDIHKLWDKHLIAINPDTKQVEIAKALKDSEYEKFEGKKVFTGLSQDKVPTRELLKIQYEKLKNYK